MVKKRKVSSKDWESVESFIKRELNRRQGSEFRKKAERKWKEIDRQIEMEPMVKLDANGNSISEGWHNVFELGELAKTSEIISDDVRRLVFPDARSWLEAHSKLPPSVDPQTGQPVPVPQEIQAKIDGIVRAFLLQQHKDFGLKDRFDLSVKEALHHGSFVATAEMESLFKVYSGTDTEVIEAPVWKAHSMWNCYPDESPSIVNAGLFYKGSMIITSYMPRYQVLNLKGDGYMIDANKIPKKSKKVKDIETEDVEIVTYYGDISIERGDGDIYLPNSKVVLANGVIIYYRANPLPYPEVLMGGYEKQDVRSPYFTSPIIKLSPTQKLATILANKFIDTVELAAEPPIVYDGSDPAFVENGGPAIYPGAKTASKGSAKFDQLKIGDPNAVLAGLQMAIKQIQEGTGVNSVRSGAEVSDRATAFEINKIGQASEIRTVNFIDKLECSLNSFLYMQYELNKQNNVKYSFYNAEVNAPDFMTLKAEELPDFVHFEVVGSKGLLGEEQRTQRTTQVTAFASGNPLFAPLLKPEDILLEMYRDAGVKGPESFVQTGKPQIPPELKVALQKMQEEQGQLQQALQQSQQENQQLKNNSQLKAQEAQEKLQIHASKVAGDLQIKQASEQADFQLKAQQQAHQQMLDHVSSLHEQHQAITDAKFDKIMQIVGMRNNQTENNQDV